MGHRILKIHYAQEIETWVATSGEIAGFGVVYNRTAIMTSVNFFERSGLCLCNRHLFSNVAFIFSYKILDRLTEDIHALCDSDETSSKSAAIRPSDISPVSSKPSSSAGNSSHSEGAPSITYSCYKNELVEKKKSPKRVNRKHAIKKNKSAITKASTLNKPTTNPPTSTTYTKNEETITQEKERDFARFPSDRFTSECEGNQCLGDSESDEGTEYCAEQDIDCTSCSDSFLSN